jgi:hypothetical protein
LLSTDDADEDIPLETNDDEEDGRELDILLLIEEELELDCEEEADIEAAT